jgi:hypothetical protein
MIASVHNLKQHNKAKPVRRIWLLFCQTALSLRFIDDFTAFLREEASICANTLRLCSSHNG